MRAEQERKIEVKEVHRAAPQLWRGAEAGRASRVCQGVSAAFRGQHGSLGPSRPAWPRRYSREKWHLRTAGRPCHSGRGREGPAGHPCRCPRLAEGPQGLGPILPPGKGIGRGREKEYVPKVIWLLPEGWAVIPAPRCLVPSRMGSHAFDHPPAPGL